MSSLSACANFQNALLSEEKARKAAMLTGATPDEIERLVAQEALNTHRARMAWMVELDAEGDYGEDERYLFPCG
jgi:hypothetical protein